MSIDLELRHLKSLDSDLHARLLKLIAGRIEQGRLFASLGLLADLMSWSFDDLIRWLRTSQSQVWKCKEDRRLSMLEPFFVQFKSLAVAGFGIQELLQHYDKVGDAALNLSYNLPWELLNSDIYITGHGETEVVTKREITQAVLDEIRQEDVWLRGQEIAGSADYRNSVRVLIDETISAHDPQLVHSIVDLLVADTCLEKVLLHESALQWLQECGIEYDSSNLSFSKINVECFGPIIGRMEPLIKKGFSMLGKENEPVSVARLSDLGSNSRPACHTIVSHAAASGGNLLSVTPGWTWPVHLEVESTGWSQDFCCVVRFTFGPSVKSLSGFTM